MTAAAAIYTPAGPVIVADSLTMHESQRLAARKIWTSGEWAFAAAGDAAVVMTLQLGDIDLTADTVGRSILRLREAIRAAATESGLLRDGAQGTTFVHVDVVAAHPEHGIWFIGEGKDIIQWRPEDGPCIVGCPDIVRAAWLGMGGSVTTASMLDALKIAAQVSPTTVGGPYRVCEWADGWRMGGVP